MPEFAISDRMVLAGLVLHGQVIALAPDRSAAILVVTSTQALALTIGTF